MARKRLKNICVLAHIFLHIHHMIEELLRIIVGHT